jgi:threonine dehydrogenase-like Zn-dependent dehydrogenase
VKVLVAPELGRLEVGEADVPSIGPGQVLVRTVVSGVSAGTEKRKLFVAELGPRDERAPWPAIGGFGYMASGVVEKVAPDVASTTLKPGDRVFAGRTWGGHRELIDTAAASVLRIPDELGWAEAACSYWAVPPLLGLLAAAPTYYDDTAVVGLGPLGLMGVQLLGRSARRVIAVDPVPARRAMAERFGALALEPGDGVVDRVRDLFGGGLPEVVLEVSGTQPGLETALSIVRPKGRVALVGSQQRLSNFDLFWPLQHSGATVVPLFRPGPASVQAAAGAESPIQRQLPLVHELLLRGGLEIGPLITWVVSPEQAPRAMDLLHRRPDLGVGLAVDWDGGQARNADAFEAAWHDDATGLPSPA